MAAIVEFTSNPGKTFLISAYDPETSVLLATGIECVEIRAGRYRASLGSLTGVVWIEAVAGATLTVGFADLSNQDGNGYSEVTDDRTSPRKISNQITSLGDGIAESVVIGLGGVEPRIISAYDPRKRLLSLVQLDDYSYTSRSHIDLAINLPAGVDADACSVLFSAVHQEIETNRIDLTLNLVSVTGRYFVRFQATALQMTVLNGFYDWQAVVVETANSRRVTVISGIADVAKAVVALA